MSNWGSYATNNERDYESDLSSYDDSEGEDLPPLQISSWGDNNVVARVNDQGTTEVNVSSNGWASLIDPNIKIGPNGLGTGNLHRKGGNFKPVDEEYILNHRLKKGSGLPKPPGSGKKKKQASAHGRGGGSSGRHTGPPPRQGYRPPPPPPPSTTRRPPPQSRPGNSGASGWGNQKLADTPFWEQPATARDTPTQVPPPPRAPVNTAAPPRNQQAFSSGAAASKYASGASVSKYAPRQPQQQPQQQQPAYNTPLSSGSSTSRYAPQQQQAPVAPASSAPTSPPFSSGAAASKYASGSAASKYAPQNASSNASIYAHPSADAHPPPPPPQQHYQYQQPPQSQPQQPQQERKPILTFNIELVPGVSAPLNVYENSNPIELVDIFEREHNLHMQPVAKETFAKNIETLVNHELQKRYA